MGIYKNILLLTFALIFSTAPADAQKHKTAKPKAVATVPTIQKRYEMYQESPILKVMFTDSIHTTLSKITNHIVLPEHAGKLINIGNDIGYENSFAGIRLLTKKNSKGHSRLYQQMLLGKEWSEPLELRIDEDFSDICSPWLMPDGQTLYFSAREQNSEEDNNSFNLYTSTLNTSTHEFMKPQKLPMPLNGDSDDLYYIENEIDHVAYFVTTRNQKKGDVTLYVLKPNEPWEYYNNDDLSSERLVSLAELWKISDTWESTAKRDNELKRLKELSTLYTPKNTKEVLITLANGKEITDVSQFQSPAAKSLLRKYLEVKGSITEAERQLDEYRTMYHKSNESARKPLANTILSFEKKIEEQHKLLFSIHNELMTAE